MQRWEYWTVETGRIMNPDVLNDLGGQGWELVNLAITPRGGYVYIFKRPAG